ncbi:MAG TPA: hypothetical protein VF600_03225 [Abditibacteriaceae bacterium]|jgi:hypothetical protein
MPTLIKYLLSMIVHMMWSRMGKGPVPPIRVPRKGPVNLPVVGPWQVMIGMWLMNKLWDRYGRELKMHLMSAQHPAVRNAGSLIPDPKNAPQNSTAAGNTSTPAPAAQSTTPATVTAPVSAQNTASQTSNPQPSVSHKTQLLSNSAQTAQPAAAHSTTASGNSSRRLSPGSILSSLRRTNSSNQPAQG